MKRLFLHLAAAAGFALSSVAQDIPVVSIHSERSRTSEPLIAGLVAPGTFVVSRSGNRDHPLQVFLSYAGTAINGVDYEKLPESVLIPAGRESATNLLVLGKADDLVEGTETVIASIVPVSPAADGGLIEGYHVNPEKGRAVVEIADEDGGGIPGVPVISVVADPSSTSEPGPLIRVAPGAFVFKRSGPIEQELTVFYRVDGTATPGRDYDMLTGSVVFEAGRELAVVHVMAIDDDEVESDETVVVEIATASGIVAPYESSPEHGIARVLIRDSDQASEATIAITSPANGAVFPSDQEIQVDAVAVDPNGYISRVEFYANERLIGVSDIVFVRAPDPGTPIHHTLAWTNPAAGSYTLTARGVDSNGTRVSSEPVRVTVGDVFAGEGVRLTSPRNGSVFPAGADVEIRASADHLERLERFEIHVNERLLASTDGRDLLVVWTRPKPGSYTIVARALTAAGVFEDKIAILVREGEIVPLPTRPSEAKLEVPRFLPDGNGGIRLQVKGGTNELCRLEVSTNLVEWESAGEYFLPKGALEVEDSAGGPRKFYRLRAAE